MKLCSLLTDKKSILLKSQECFTNFEHFTSFQIIHLKICVNKYSGKGEDHFVSLLFILVFIINIKDFSSKVQICRIF